MKGVMRMGHEELKVLKSETWVAPVTEPVLEEPTI